VNAWPPSSWLKSFSKYLAAENKYFVYPRISLTSNYGDTGIHIGIPNSLFQVSFAFG